MEKARVLRKRSIRELSHKLGELEEKLTRISFGVRTGQAKDHRSGRFARREVAQIKTIIREKEKDAKK